MWKLKNMEEQTKILRRMVDGGEDGLEHVSESPAAVHTVHNYTITLTLRHIQHRTVSQAPSGIS